MLALTEGSWRRSAKGSAALQAEPGAFGVLRTAAGADDHCVPESTGRSVARGRFAFLARGDVALPFLTPRHDVAGDLHRVRLGPRLVAQRATGPGGLVPRRTAVGHPLGDRALVAVI